MLPHQSANKLGFTIETVLQSDICSVELSVIGKAAKIGILKENKQSNISSSFFILVVC
jgi:hypothetical protein